MRDPTGPVIHVPVCVLASQIFFFNLWGVPAGNEMDKSQQCPQDSEIALLNRLLFEKESCIPRAKGWVWRVQRKADHNSGNPIRVPRGELTKAPF